MNPDEAKRRAWQFAVMAADEAVLVTQHDPPLRTQADIVHAAVAAALDCLVVNGIVTIRPPEEWPEFVMTSPPFTPGNPETDR